MEAMIEEASSCSPRRKGRGRKPRGLPPFLSKTFDLLESSSTPDIVSWNRDGTGFVVWSPEEFAQSVLPRYFKHCNFSSFIRQLNTYGFKKFSSDRWEFKHEKFQKGSRNLLEGISRRQCKPSIFPHFLKACNKISSNTDNDLIEENKALQKVNAQLLLEIQRYKDLEAHLLKFMKKIT